MIGMPKNEEFVSMETNISDPVTSLLKPKKRLRKSVKTAVTVITIQAIMIGIKSSCENVNFGTCNSIIAGSETKITNWFRVFGASSEKI